MKTYTEILELLTLLFWYGQALRLILIHLKEFYEAKRYPADLPKGDLAFKGKMIYNVIHPRTQSHFKTLIAFLYYSWIFHSFLWLSGEIVINTSGQIPKHMLSLVS